MMDQDKATELVHEIGAMIVHSEKYLARDWESISVVVIADAGAVQISGYTYDASGEACAGTPGTFALSDKFEALQEAMREQEGRKWKSCLVQIRRPTGEITITFEYDDAMRWKVTPTNLAAMTEAMRPK